MPLENLLKSDVFFVVTTLTVMVMALMSVIVGIYVIRILRDVRALIKDITQRYEHVRRIINRILTF